MVKIVAPPLSGGPGVTIPMEVAIARLVAAGQCPAMAGDDQGMTSVGTQIFSCVVQLVLV